MVADFMSLSSNRTGNRWTSADVDAALEERGPHAEPGKQIQQRESTFAGTIIESQGYCTPVLRPSPD